MRIFDTRWVGAHGIGRFAAEVHARIGGFEPIGIGGSPSAPLDPLRLWRYLRHESPELFFSPGYNAPLRVTCPFAFCIHDLAHLYVKEYASLARRAYYETIVRGAIRHAAVVFTVSEYSRTGICEWAGISPDRVLNVGNGVSEVFRPDGAAQVRRRPYFLHVGNCRPHKNIGRVLEAFARSGMPGDVDLVCTGGASAQVRARIRALGLDDAVSFEGQLSDDGLAKLYRGALALVFVSSYEGFGLPIVEAMACGTPVLTSAAAAMPETAAGAALLADPLDVDAIQEGMLRLLTDDALRQRLRLDGLERASFFSWTTTANRIGGILGEISPGRGRA